MAKNTVLKRMGKILSLWFLLVGAKLDDGNTMAMNI